MDGRETGTVKAWIEARGMGFITPATGGEDHFVHRSMLTDGVCLQIGAQVTYIPSVDPAKNKPTAEQVQGASPAPEGGAAAPAWGAAGQQPWAAAAPAWSPAGKGGCKGGGGGSAIGTVKAWIDNRGMGFITPGDGGEDLFVHRSMLTDGHSLVIGTQVSYDPGWDAMKNKGIAQNVSGATPAAVAQSNLYIAGLPSDVTDDKVHQIFGQYGTIASMKLLPDNGSPSRVCLLKMGDAKQAEWLVMNVDGNIPLGMDCVVNIKYANEKSGGAGAGGGCGGAAWAPPAQPAWGGKPSMPPSKGANLYMCGFPVDATNESVQSILSQYGTVNSVKVLPPNGKPDAAALVLMNTVDEAEWIVDNLNGNMPQGLDSPLSIKYANPSGGGGGGGGGYGVAPPAWGGAKGGTPYGKGGGKGVPQPWQQQQPAWQAAPAAPAAKDKVHIFGLPAGSTMQSVSEVIGQYGTVTSVAMRPDGSVIVQMGDQSEAQWIVENLDGNIPQGLEAVISVKHATGAAPAVVPAGGGGAPPQGFTTGTVKHWVEERGMGFIGTGAAGEDCFVHRSNLIDGLSLVVGSTVTFQLDWDHQKNKATANHVTGAVGGDGVGKGAGKAAAKGITPPAIGW